MPPFHIQKESIKSQNLEMGDDIFRENLSQRQLVSSGDSDGSSRDDREIQNSNSSFQRHQILAVAILCYVNLINYMDRYTVAGLLIDIGEAFDLTDGQKGLLQTVFIIVYMFMAPLYGYLGDRYNRKLLMCSGVFLWSLTTLIGSFMPSFGWFLLMRCFVGVGEASYSTIAPTIISDYFVGDKRSKMLSIFYFAIPVGSGLGYIIGSKVGDIAENVLPDDAKADAWRYGLRVTPIMGLVAVLLLIFVLREPPRGEVEGAQNMEPTTFWQDLKFLAINKSYVLSTVAFTCVTYVAGALAWWGPTYVEYGAKIQPDPNVPEDAISFWFGVIAMVAGLIGVPLGAAIGRKLRVRYGFADPVVCGAGVLFSSPLLVWGMLWSDSNIIGAFITVLFGQILLNLNWAIVSDIILYTCVPTRRSSATAFQILVSHMFGDAGSPYFVGFIAEAFKPLVEDNHFNSTTAETFLINATSTMSTLVTDDPNEDYIQFKSLQYSLLISCIFLVLGAIFFFWTAVHIMKDKSQCEHMIAGDSSIGIQTRLPTETISRYEEEGDIEQRDHLIV